MANGRTYGINFPFRDSFNGTYLDLTEYSDAEIRANLIHLLLTRKGSRYFLPNFGTRLYEYIFEPLDGPTFDGIETDIRESCEQYLPNLKITNITITALTGEEETQLVSNQQNIDNQQLYLPNQNVSEYTAKVRIDYVNTNSVFNSPDFVIINI